MKYQHLVSLALAAALLLYLLPGMALEAKAETVRNICFFL